MTFRLGLQFSNGVQGIQLFASTQLFKRSPCSLHLGSLGNLMTLIFVKYHKHAGVKVLCLSFCPFRFDGWRCRGTYRVKSYGHFFDFALIAFFSATSQRNVKEYSVSFYLGVCDFFFISLEIGIDTGSAKRKEKKGKKKRRYFTTIAPNWMRTLHVFTLLSSFNFVSQNKSLNSWFHAEKKIVLGHLWVQLRLYGCGSNVFFFFTFYIWSETFPCRYCHNHSHIIIGDTAPGFVFWLHHRLQLRLFLGFRL